MGIQFYKKSITRSLIIFKKLRKMTSDFFNNYIFVHTVQWTSSEIFFNFRFSIRKSQSKQKLTKKINHLTIQLLSKNLAHFTNLNSHDIEKYMLPQHSQKPFSLYKFSKKEFGWRKKNIYTAPFLDAQERHYRSTLKANVCIYLYISLRKFLSQRRIKLLSGFVFYLLNNFLEVAHCFGPRKMFYNFSF